MRATWLTNHWPKFVELWILATIVVFFVVRILGSHSAERLFHSLAGH